MAYTINEFRKNLRQAFEDADHGHEVIVERYGQLFQLVSLVDQPLPDHSFESVPKIPPVLKKPKDTLEAVSDKIEKACKHGFPPAFCRFAKPGKPCK